MALLGSLQGALGGKEVARGVVGLVVGAADLRRKTQTGEFLSGVTYRTGVLFHQLNVCLTLSSNLVNTSH